MKILHTSDWHLGQLFYGQSREQEQAAFLRWLVNQAETHQADAILVAGDLFDTGTPPSYARALYNHFIVDLQRACPACQLILLAGNHDSVAVLNESKGLLNALNTQVIAGADPQALAEWQTAEEPHLEPAADRKLPEPLHRLTNRAGETEAILCAIPFLRPSDLMRSRGECSAEERKRQLQQQISDYYHSLYRLAKEHYPELPVVMTGHLTTVGASTSESVKEIYIGTLDAFPASAFPPADYIALGHIHRPQKVANSEHIRYCGAPMMLSFDELKKEKQILLVELNDEGFVSADPLPVPVFQPLARLSGDLTAIEQQISALAGTLTQLEPQQRLWLEVQVETDDYLSDLQQRVADLIGDRPMDVLRIRRQQSVRLSLADQLPKVQLDELTPSDVFQRRLSQEALEPERIDALTACFNSILQEDEA